MSLVVAVIVFCLTLAALEVLHYLERKETNRKHQVETVRFRDERNELVYQIREISDTFAKERAELLDRIQSDSFREYKTQQIRMTRAQNKVETEHPPFELL